MAAAVLASWPRFCAAGKSRAIYSGERGAPEELHRVHQSRQTRTMVRWGIGVRLRVGGPIPADFVTAIGAGRRLAGIYSIAETRPAEILVDVEAPMSSDRHFPIRSFIGSVVLVAFAAASVYLSYELVVKPRRALQDQIREQKETILKIEQEKQRLEAYLKILKHIDRRARVEVLRQAKDQQLSLIHISEPTRPY